MEPLLVRCLFCGPFALDADKSAVDQLHEHATSHAHQDLVRLDKELNVLHYLGDG